MIFWGCCWFLFVWGFFVRDALLALVRDDLDALPVHP